jgi:hypothetical protein
MRTFPAILRGQLLSRPKTDDKNLTAFLMRVHYDRPGESVMAAQEFQYLATNAILQQLKLSGFGDEFNYSGIQSTRFCLKICFRGGSCIPQFIASNGEVTYIGFQFNVLKTHTQAGSLFYPCQSEGGAFRCICSRGAEYAFPG